MDDCSCVIRLDMTTPPWWREKGMVYYMFVGCNLGPWLQPRSLVFMAQPCVKMRLVSMNPY